MGEAENFKKLVENKPIEALKYVKELKQNAFWKFLKFKMGRELDGCDAQLRSCEIEKITFVRGYRKGIEYVQSLPESLIESLKDEIAIQKESAKVEEARQPIAKE